MKQKGEISFKALHWLPVIDIIIFKIVVFVSLMVPCHHTCHHVSVYTPSHALSSSSDEKLFLVQDGNLRALVTSHSLFWLPLSGTTFLLTPETAEGLSAKSDPGGDRYYVGCLGQTNILLPK